MTEREDIDDSLQEEAMRIGGLRTREETVNQALWNPSGDAMLKNLSQPSALLTLMKAMITGQKESGAPETSRMAVQAGVLLRHLTS